jgi:hypothetical protein
MSPERRRAQIGEYVVADQIDEGEPIRLMEICGVDFNTLYDAYRTLFRLIFVPHDTREDLRNEDDATSIVNILPTRDQRASRLRILANTVRSLLKWLAWIRSPDASYADRQSFPSRVNGLLNDLAEYESELNKYEVINVVHSIKKMIRDARKLLTSASGKQTRYE